MKLIGDMAIKDLTPKTTNIGDRIVKNMRICGSGIYTYGRTEASLLGLTPIPEQYKDLKLINVFRPAEVLVANKDKFARVPIITGRHVKVDRDNAKQLVVGMVGDSVEAEVDSEDGETYLYTTGTIVAGDGVEAYEEYGQLSVGYVPRMKWQSGVHKGVEYQAVLEGFDDVNHLLICKVARGGPQCMVMDSLDDCSPLERFINVHTGHETQNGGEDMKLFTKIFGSTRKQVAGDSNVVSVLLQSISVGADPKIQVGKIRAIVGDSDTVFNEYLGELEMAGDEKPEVVAKAVDIVDAYYKDHFCGDEKTIEVKKEDKDGKEEKNVEVKKDGKETKDIEVKKDGDGEKEVTVKEAGDACHGDSIDYEKLATLVVEKLQPKKDVAGDELENEKESSMPMAGDASVETKDSSSFIADIFGGNE